MNDNVDAFAKLVATTLRRKALRLRMWAADIRSVPPSELMKATHEANTFEQAALIVEKLGRGEPIE